MKSPRMAHGRMHSPQIAQKKSKTGSRLERRMHHASLCAGNGVVRTCRVRQYRLRCVGIGAGKWKRREGPEARARAASDRVRRLVPGALHGVTRRRRRHLREHAHPRLWRQCDTDLVVDTAAAHTLTAKHVGSTAIRAGTVSLDPGCSSCCSSCCCSSCYCCSSVVRHVGRRLTPRAGARGGAIGSELSQRRCWRHRAAQERPRPIDCTAGTRAHPRKHTRAQARERQSRRRRAFARTEPRPYSCIGHGH